MTPYELYMEKVAALSDFMRGAEHLMSAAKAPKHVMGPGGTPLSIHGPASPQGEALHSANQSFQAGMKPLHDAVSGATGNIGKATKGLDDRGFFTPAGIGVALTAGAMAGPHVMALGRKALGAVRGARAAAPAARGALSTNQKIGLGVAGGAIGSYALMNTKSGSSDQSAQVLGAGALGSGAVLAGMDSARKIEAARNMATSSRFHAGMAGLAGVGTGLAGTLTARAEGLSALTGASTTLSLLGATGREAHASRSMARAALAARSRAMMSGGLAGAAGVGALGFGAAAMMGRE